MADKEEEIKILPYEPVVDMQNRPKKNFKVSAIVNKVKDYNLARDWQTANTLASQGGAGKSALWHMKLNPEAPQHHRAGAIQSMYGMLSKKGFEKIPVVGNVKRGLEKIKAGVYDLPGLQRASTAEALCKEYRRNEQALIYLADSGKISWQDLNTEAANLARLFKQRQEEIIKNNPLAAKYIANWMVKDLENGETLRHILWPELVPGALATWKQRQQSFSEVK